MKLPKKVKTLQMAIGVDLIGSRMSLAQKPSEDRMTVIPGAGVLITGQKGRAVLIPFSNIKGMEFHPDEPDAKG
jgi:hypothetical protein